MNTPHRPAPARTLAVAFGTLLVAFLVRIANFQTAFVGGVPQLSPFDEMYHAKRIVYSAAHPFRVLSFDPNRGRNGTFCPWPPLYDLTAGALARLLGGRTPIEVVARASWFPPLVASLVAAAVAAWLSRRLGPVTGLLAGMGVAFSTYFLDRSRLTAIDHHFLEFPLVLGLAVAVSVLAAATSAREAVRNGGILGLALTTALLVQPALLLAAAIALGAVLLLDSRQHFARMGAAGGFLLSAGLVLLYRRLQPAGYPDSEWYLGIPHAAALAGAAAACAAQVWFLERGATRTRAIVLALGIGAAVIASVPNAADALVGGSHFLAGDVWLKSIAEFRPLLFHPESVWWVDLCLLGGGFFLTVGMAVSGGWKTGGRVILFLFALACSFAAVSSTRFLSVSAPLCAISGAIAVADLRRQKGAAFAAAGAVLLLAPSLLLSARRVIRPAPAVTPQAVPLLRAAEFLRGYPAPGRVIGPWSWGHLFNVVGGRGVLLDNFGVMGGRTDFENTTAITLSPREKAVADYCSSKGVRFIVLQNPIPYFAAHAEMSGLPRAAFEEPGARSSSRFPATPLMTSTFWWRAYFEGGRARPGRGPAGAAFLNFRLTRVEAPPPPSDSRSVVQIWELLDQPIGPPAAQPATALELGQKETVPIARDRFSSSEERPRGPGGPQGPPLS